MRTPLAALLATLLVVSPGCSYLRVEAPSPDPAVPCTESLKYPYADIGLAVLWMIPGILGTAEGLGRSECIGVGCEDEEGDSKWLLIGIPALVAGAAHGISASLGFRRTAACKARNRAFAPRPG